MVGEYGRLAALTAVVLAMGALASRIYRVVLGHCEPGPRDLILGRLPTAEIAVSPRNISMLSAS